MRMAFLKKIFINRAFFILLAVMLQLFIWVGVLERFANYFAYFYAFSIGVSILVVLGILNDRSNPAYKIAWLIPILLFPFFGGLFYLFIGRHSLSNKSKQSMQEINLKTQESLNPNHEALDQLEALNPLAANQARYIQGFSLYPIHVNTQVWYLSSGEAKFNRLMSALKDAQRFIFLEYFIIEEGLMWNSILEVLKEKAQMGLDVRLIYDDVGCLFKLPYGYDKKLEALGIRCCIFNPLTPSLSIKGNTRDHRKIAIIDGTIAFTGGINLADEYINAYRKYGHWKDTAVMFKGSAVNNFTVAFLAIWDYLRSEDEDYMLFLQPGLSERDALADQGFIQPFVDSPLDNESVGETIYFNLINKAQRYVYIMTPYLIISNEMVMALCASAKSGVDVKIITPHIADKWFVHEVTQSYYRTLTECGVKIYEYTPGFMHAKTFLVDDQYGVVGTINMDYRSLYLHFECGVWMYQTPALAAMKADFLSCLEKSHEISHAYFKQRTWPRTMLSTLLKVFAPLL